MLFARCVREADTIVLCSKLFTITFTLNMIGIGLAASGHWPYAIKYNGAMAVANFNFSILMRNEIFGRLLYLFVNTCFAKVRHLVLPVICRRWAEDCPFNSGLR